MGWSYQDTCGQTTAIDYYITLLNTGAPVYHVTQTPVTTGIYLLSYTVPNIRGNQYQWWQNATRNV
jgi:hypothetical protein